MIPEFFEEPEESDVTIASLQRTKPLYPTFGPGDGRSWHDYFTQMRDARKIPEAEESEPARPVILDPWHRLEDPASALSARSAAGQLYKRLSGAGWDVIAAQGRVRMPATLYVNASEDGEHQAGDVLYPEHELTSTRVLGCKRVNGRIGLAVEANWTSKGFVCAKTFDPVLGRQWITTVTKPRKQREWEKEEGAAPTWGLNQWLSVVCPKGEAGQ